MIDPITYLREFEQASSDSRLYSFSTTRHGGCSKGNYASLNLTPYTGDDLSAVEHNRQMLCNHLHISRSQLIMPYQTHGSQVLIVDQPFLALPDDQRTQALQGIDALITNQRDICLAVSTADCIPLVVYDPHRGAIAAIHAGWRGTLGGVIEHTLEQMKAHYGSHMADLKVALGPGISAQAFEVGDEVAEAFLNAGFRQGDVILHYPHKAKCHIDLPKATQQILLKCGIPYRAITPSGICTYTHVDRFFSARRLGISSGRIVTGIILYNCNR